MGLEVGATYINDLVASNPVGTDQKLQGDDHIRLVKNVLKQTFPNATVPFRFPHTTAAKTASYTVTTADKGCLIPVDASGGAVTITLPLGGGASALDDAFAVEIIRVDSNIDVNVTIVTTGGDTINGLSNRILFDQWSSVRLIWFESASTWYAPVMDGVPIGTTHDWWAGSVPDGYLLLTGSNRVTTALATAYPALYDLWGTSFGGDATNFGLPNVSGYHPRYIGHDTSVDTAGERTANNKQGDALLTHLHGDGTLALAGNGISGEKAFISGGTTSQYRNGIAPAGFINPYTGLTQGTAPTLTVANTDVSGSTSNYNGQAENRVNNVAMHCILKAR